MLSLRSSKFSIVPLRSSLTSNATAVRWNSNIPEDLRKTVQAKREKVAQLEQEISELEQQLAKVQPPLPKRNEIYFPNFKIHVTKNGISEKKGTKYKQVIMKTAHNVGKFDIKNFLTSVYGMKIVGVNTANYDKRVTKTATLRGIRVNVRKGFKKVWVTFEDTFMDQPIEDSPNTVEFEVSKAKKTPAKQKEATQEQTQSLGNEQDITLRGLEAIKMCDSIYLESYTSVLCVGQERLSQFYGKNIQLADREMVEQGCDSMLELSKEKNVAFLVVGDPFGATTHTDIVLRAKQMGIEVKVIHNASIMNAVGCCGLQLYNFGQTVSIVFFEENWRPDSFYDKIKINRNQGAHTLCLLDIKMKEQTVENLLKGNKIYEPPRFMTVNQCISQLLEVEEKRKEKVYSKDTLVIGLARVGQDDQLIVSGTMEELLEVDFGKPLHSFVIPGHLHPLEQDFVNLYKVKK